MAFLWGVVIGYIWLMLKDEAGCGGFSSAVDSLRMGQIRIASYN